MTEISEAIRRLQALICECEQSAYQRGWDDAIRKMMAAAELPPQRKTYGLAPTLIKRIVQDAGPGGVTTKEIVEHAAKEGEELKQATIRSALRRLKVLGTVQKIGDRWSIPDTETPDGQGKEE